MRLVIDLAVLCISYVELKHIDNSMIIDVYQGNHIVIAIVIAI